MRLNEFTEQPVEEGYYDLPNQGNLPGMEPIDFSSNPSFKELVTRYTQLVYQGHTSETDPEEDQEHDEIEQYVARRFGEKGSAHLQKAGEVSYWGRDDGHGSGHIRSSNLGRPNQPGGNFRTTKSGKMHGQDVKMMKNKVADRLGHHPEPALPEGVDQLPTRGADYSEYDTDHLKMMLRPGILHRNEARFKSLIRQELKKREQQGVVEGSLNELAPSPGFGGDDDDDKYTPADYGKPFKANYLGQNKFEVFCRKPQDPSNVIKLNAEVQKYGLEWEDDFGFWFLDSPGAVYLSWKYGEIPLPKAIDQARNPGHIHDLVTDYLTNSPHAAEIQKIATEYFGFTADGEMNEGVAEGNYDDNRTGFSRGARDDERHDLDIPRPLIYGLKINGKIWQKDGNTVTFFTKERALAARNAILAKRPDVEIGLVQRPKD
jgi:hypothetical protein